MWRRFTAITITELVGDSEGSFGADFDRVGRSRRGGHGDRERFPSISMAPPIVMSAGESDGVLRMLEVESEVVFEGRRERTSRWVNSGGRHFP